MLALPDGRKSWVFRSGGRHSAQTVEVEAEGAIATRTAEARPRAVPVPTFPLAQMRKSFGLPPDLGTGI